jgi:tetratricopeptide (TPR) repeat protein
VKRCLTTFRSSAAYLLKAKRSLVVAALLVAAILVPRTIHAASASETLAQANNAFQAGEADKAQQLISSLPQGGSGSAEAQNLACRIHYALQQWNTAVPECEKSVQLDGQNSDYHLWLGRALGLKAEHASFFSAYGLAKRVLSEFQKAAQLNPHSPDALTDLGDFYRSAPGIVGGGLDKAEQVAKQLDSVEPSKAHQLRAEIAESRSDYGTAEREFKEAVSKSAHPALHWTVLANFYRKRKRFSDMESAIHSAEGTARKDPHATIALYDAAGVLIDGKMDPGTAARLLEEYLASPTKTEEGPAFEAHVRLARMKKQLGDSAGAQQQIKEALALAYDYKPALEFGR